MTLSPTRALRFTVLFAQRQLDGAKYGKLWYSFDRKEVKYLDEGASIAVAILNLNGIKAGIKDSELATPDDLKHIEEC